MRTNRVLVVAALGAVWLAVGLAGCDSPEQKQALTPPTTAATTPGAATPTRTARLSAWTPQVNTICADIARQLRVQSSAAGMDENSQIMVTAQIFALAYDAVARLPRPTDDQASSLISELGTFATAWTTLARAVRQGGEAEVRGAHQAIDNSRLDVIRAATQIKAGHCIALARR